MKIRILSFLELLDSEELDNGSSCGESSGSGLGSGYEEIGTSGGKNMIQISQDPRPTLEIGRSPLENIEQPQPSLEINILGAKNIEQSQPTLEINILGIESEGEATNMQKNFQNTREINTDTNASKELIVYSRRNLTQKNDDSTLLEGHDSNPRTDNLKRHELDKNSYFEYDLHTSIFPSVSYHDLSVPIANRKGVRSVLNLLCPILCHISGYLPHLLHSLHNFIVYKFLKVCRML